jgi:CRISPR/Cas system-associated exonuclease Cas4 (RecB family)
MPSANELTLSKSKILSLLQCPKRLWLEQHRPELAQEDEGAQARLTAGTRVGEVARGLFPKGILVEGKSMEARFQRTRKLLRGYAGPLFEPAFLHNRVRVMADVLLPKAGGFTLIEVKSATSVKEYHLQDVAIQAWVLQGAGLDLRGLELAVINTDFVYPGGGKYRGLFVQENVRKEVKALLPQVPGWVEQGLAVLAAKKAPKETPGDQCGSPFPCPFQGYCCQDETEYPVELLPYIGKRAKKLRAEGWRDIREVPASYPLTDTQRRVREVTKRGRAVLSPEAKDEIDGLSWPRQYMDFETVAPAVPEWAGTRPYQQVPFQWSGHVEAEDGSLRHHEFLAEGDGDPRRAFAESLVAGFTGPGPVLVYNATFEKRILKETAEAFPDLARKLKRISARVFDLLPVARKYYYHPAMRGSWSIKSVLPTVAPDLTYTGLAVSDGGEAQTAFQEMRALPKGSAEREEGRRALLEYCERDTYAMVVLARFFAGKKRARQGRRRQAQA